MISEKIGNEIKSEWLSFDCAVEQVKNRVHDVLVHSPTIIRKYTNHLAKSTGKFIRAESLMACAIGCDGQIDEGAVKAAAAIEILHLATLVHDDVIDNATKRRGMDTVHKKFGKRTAVVCGDYLFCVALKTVSGIREKESYFKLDIPDYMSRICLGELSQHINSNNFDLSVYQYLKIIAGKTAALFEASFFAGAVLCKNEEELSKYRRLGRYIGMVFQLGDDCADFEKSEADAKKTVRSDFEQGVITLPLIHVLKNKENFKQSVKSGFVNKADVMEAVIKTGGITFTRHVAKRYYEKAAAIINSLNADAEKKKKLTVILHRAYNGC